jgi:P27 family predicted phage terminase small subunit
MRGSRAADGRQRPKGPKGRPRCPSWLPTEGKKKWPEVCDQLQAMGILSTADLSIIAVYCSAWADLIRTTAVIEQEGSTVVCGTGGLKPHPAVRERQTAMDALRQIAPMLGLTPEGRLRLHVEEEDPKPGGIPSRDRKAQYFAD